MIEQPKFEISDEDRMAIADMMQSRGWEVLVTQVWSAQKEWMRDYICGVKDDIRFMQGQYLGFMFAQQMAVEMSKPQPDIKPPRLASELDLVSRRY